MFFISRCADGCSRRGTYHLVRIRDRMLSLFALQQACALVDVAGYLKQVHRLRIKA